jgi:hypothetical protein
MLTKFQFCQLHNVSTETLRRRVISLYKERKQNDYALPPNYLSYSRQKLLTSSQIENLNKIF